MEEKSDQRRLVLLEKALADYVVRYGMTEDARKAMLCHKRAKVDATA